MVRIPPAVPNILIISIIYGAAVQDTGTAPAERTRGGPPQTEITIVMRLVRKFILFDASNVLERGFEPPAIIRHGCQNDGRQANSDAGAPLRPHGFDRTQDSGTAQLGRKATGNRSGPRDLESCEPLYAEVRLGPPVILRTATEKAAFEMRNCLVGVAHYSVRGVQSLRREWERPSI